MSSTTSPNWPCPPDCFLCRPRTSTPFLMVSLYGTCRRCDSASTPYLRLRRSSDTRRCISPWPHSTIWWVSLECSSLSEGSSSISLASAPVSFTSSLRSLMLMATPYTGSGGRGGLTCVPPPLSADSVSPGSASSPAGPAPPCRRPWPCPRLRASWPSIENADAARSSERAPCTMVPSPNSPASTRTIDSLPPCAEYMVFSTCAADLAFSSFRRLAVRVHERRLMAQRLQQPQDAVAVLGRAQQHRHDQAVLHLLDEIGEHLVARRLHVRQQLLHQLVVVVGELLQHMEARLDSRAA